MFKGVSLAVVAVAGADGDVRLYALDSVSAVDAREIAQFGALGERSSDLSVSVDGKLRHGDDDLIVAEVRERFESARLRGSAVPAVPCAPASVSRGCGALAAGDCGFTSVGGSL